MRVGLAGALAPLLAALATSAAAQGQFPPQGTLPSLEAVALESSPLLEEARYRAEAAAARADLARSPYLPTLDFSERWSSTDNPPGAFMSILNQGRLTPEIQADLNDPDAVSDWMTAVTVRYLLTDFGGRRARREAAEADREREQVLEEVARREVLFTVREAWFDLVQQEADVRAWQATIAQLEADERRAAARHEQGAALRSDVLTLGVRRREAQESLLTAENSAAIARVRLATAVGRPLPELGLPAVPAGPEGQAGSLDVPRRERTEEDVVQAAIETHPQLLALDAAARAADASVRAARASRYPQLAAQLGWEWHGDSEDFGVERDSYLAAVVLSVPVFDGFRARAVTAEAEARRRELQAVRRQAVLGLELAARTAHRRAGEAISRIELADQSVEAADAALAIVRERHAAGLTTVTELLEAERRLTEARVRSTAARAGAWKALAAVERLAGRSDS